VPDGGGYFDPSYGQPDAGSSGFASIGDWEKASVSGFAVLLIGKRAGGGQGRVYTPAPYYDLPALLRLCARYRCLLAATPFGTGFLPSAGPLELLNNLLGPPVPAEPVACPADGADCAVQIAVKTGGHAAAAAAARSEIVGRRAVLIRHGTRRTVTAPLNATGRALLRRLHRLPVTVVVTAGRRVIGGGSLVIAAR
jgi:hypothetical protein